MKVGTLLRWVFLARLSSLTAAYSGGADISACTNGLNPTEGHEAKPQSTTSPYFISVSPSTYSPGGSALTVTLQPRCAGTTFRGFLLTARHAETTKNQNTSIGSFNTPTDARDVCTGLRTHKSNSDKESVSFQWTPPATDEGPVVFRATFVKIKAMFWVDVHSDIIQSRTPVNNNLIQPTVSTQAPNTCLTATTAAPLPTSSFPKDADCGKTKGCYSDCSGGSCGFLMSWVPNTAVVTITLQAFIGSADRYVAFGLSTDLQMGSDSVTECTRVGGTINVYNSRNEGKSNSRIGQTGLSMVSSNYMNGILTCTFTQTTTSTVTGVLNLDSTKYNIFMSRGAAYAASIDMHDSIPPRSAAAASLQDITVDVTADAVVFPLIKAHGSLMLVAWVFAASIGIVMARYFKPVWPDNTWFGQKIWFQIHRASMVLVLVATVIAFIIIFVEVGGYSEISGESFKKAHPILGIIVTALCVINPIMALFRPHPNTPRRPIFNWAHWAVGTAAHILGVITIFFGIALEKSGAPDYMRYVMAAYVAWQLLISLLLELAQCVGTNTARSDAYEMSANGDPAKPAASSEQSTFAKKILIGIHIVVIVGFIIALLVILNV